MILNHDRLRAMITAHRFADLELPGFAIKQGPDIEGNIAQWMFHRTIHEVVSGSDAIATLDGIPVAGHYVAYSAMPNEVVTVTFTLKWWWSGPDGEVVTADPPDGYTLTLEFSQAA